MLIYILSFIILAVVRYMHVAGLNGLYMEYWYYDIIMHFLGGVGVGLLTLAILNSFTPNLRHRRKLVILGAFVFGLGWEVFEIIYDIAGYALWTTPYYLDTLKDLANDSIGGAVASLFAALPIGKSFVSPFFRTLFKE